MRLVLLVLVYGRSAQLAQRMPGWKALFDDAYEAPNGEEEVIVLFHYLARVVAKEDKERVEGRAEAVLRILMVRGVSVDNKARQQILSCTDLATVELWLERAVTATHVSEVLNGSSQ